MLAAPVGAVPGQNGGYQAARGAAPAAARAAPRPPLRWGGFPEASKVVQPQLQVAGGRAAHGPQVAVAD